MSQLEKQKQRRKVILFVDDEPAILETFQMVFEFLNDDWEPHFAASGPEALKLLSQQPFQVIISDMRMPGMNGAQLMTEVMAKYPKTARLILSGYAEQEAVAKCVGAAHQFLMKPCDVTTLRNTLSRVLALDVFIDNEKTKGLVSQMGVLPSLPSLYFRIMKEAWAISRRLPTFFLYWAMLFASFCKPNTRCMAIGSSEATSIRCPVAAWFCSRFCRTVSLANWSTSESGNVLDVTRISGFSELSVSCRQPCPASRPGSSPAGPKLETPFEISSVPSFLHPATHR